jgi:hypothetical protein
MLNFVIPPGANMDFDLIETQKLGSGWHQQFFVARKKIVYLRIVGDGTEYRMMTATASEDLGGFRVCQDSERLWMAAAQLAISHKCSGEVSSDTQGRPYIRIFKIVQDNGISDTNFTNEVYDLIREFFAIYDEIKISPPQSS